MKISPIVAITHDGRRARAQPGNPGHSGTRRFTSRTTRTFHLHCSRARVLAGEMFASVGSQIGWRAGAIIGGGRVPAVTDQATSYGDNESPANFYSTVVGG